MIALSVIFYEASVSLFTEWLINLLPLVTVIVVRLLGKVATCPDTIADVGTAVVLIFREGTAETTEELKLF